MYVLGAGAIGTLWASHLNKRDIPCVLIEKANASQLSIHRVHIEYECSLNASNRITYSCSVPTTTSRKLIQDGTSISALIVATKSQHATHSVIEIKQLLTSEAEVLTLSNGLGFQDELDQLLSVHKARTLICGVTSDGALLNRRSQNNRHIKHTGQGTTYIGIWNKNKKQTNSRIIERLTQSKNFGAEPLLSVEFDTDIRQRVIEKFFINCAINSLTTVYDCSNGQLLEDAAIYKEFSKLCGELQNIVDQIKPSPISKNNKFNVLHAASSVANVTSSNTSSMLRDKQRNKPLELDYLNKHLKGLASQYDIQTPFADAVLSKLTAIQNNNIL